MAKTKHKLTERERKAAYYREHSSKLKAYQRRYHREHREERAEYSREWHAANPDYDQERYKKRKANGLCTPKQPAQ